MVCKIILNFNSSLIRNDTLLDCAEGYNIINFLQHYQSITLPKLQSFTLEKILSIQIEFRLKFYVNTKDLYFVFYRNNSGAI